MQIAQTVNAALRSVPTWPLYLVALIPPIWLFYAGVTGGLGVDPVKAMEHEMGELGLQVLIIGILVSPLRKFTGISLLKFRRAIGLIGFFYIACHLAVWLFLDVQIWSQIWADILKRPYITIGMAGFVLMIPLAITSNNKSIRLLGGTWRKLHKLVYPAVILGGVHYVMLVKGWQVEPLVYLAIILGLLATRIKIPTPRRKDSPV
ncbi:MAG: protein-methionine-sulfoxide reductase heme-binding subunit MsrQ [Maritimibacter sp.]